MCSWQTSKNGQWHSGPLADCLKPLTSLVHERFLISFLLLYTVISRETNGTDRIKCLIRWWWDVYQSKRKQTTLSGIEETWVEVNGIVTVNTFLNTSLYFVAPPTLSFSLCHQTLQQSEGRTSLSVVCFENTWLKLLIARVISNTYHRKSRSRLPQLEAKICPGPLSSSSLMREENKRKPCH